MNKKDNSIDFLYMFPKYRRLKERLKVVNRDNRNLRNNWEQQIIINDNLKEKLKQREKTIKLLRKEIKKENENRNDKRNKNNE